MNRRQQLIRDFLLVCLALFILWTQLPLDRHGPAQPILIFLVIFLFGCVPFLRGDQKGNKYGPFVRIIMSLLGVQLPENFQDSENVDETPDASFMNAGLVKSPKDGPGQSHGRTSAPSSSSAQRPSNSSSNKKGKQNVSKTSADDSESS